MQREEGFRDAFATRLRRRARVGRGGNAVSAAADIRYERE